MKKPYTRQTLLEEIKAIKTACDKEELERYEVTRTKDYQAAEEDAAGVDATMRELGAELTAIRERQREMLAGVPDSRTKLEEAKIMLMQIMEAEGVEGYVEDGITVSGKWSEKKTVDGSKLLTVLGGDIDEFTRLVKPSQKAVKDYAQERPDMKKALLSCITLESRELVGVEISIPEAA